MNDKVILAARKKIGEHLKNIREEKGLSWYALTQSSGLQYNVIQSIEDGDKAYTIDSFLKLLHGLDLYFFVADKEGKHLDFEHMVKKAK